MWQDFLVFLNGEDVEAEDLKGFPPSDVEAVLADFMAQQGVTPLRAAKLKKALRETLEIALPQQVSRPGTSGGEASPVRRASPKSLAALPIQARMSLPDAQPAEHGARFSNCCGRYFGMPLPITGPDTAGRITGSHAELLKPSR